MLVSLDHLIEWPEMGEVEEPGPGRRGLVLSWSGVAVTAGGRRILRGVTGQARPGELLAVLGASGAGKSTLLNTLLLRNQRGLVVSGVRAVNGRVVTSTSLTKVSGYVHQEEAFIAVMTVREHLHFHSLVRMERGKGVAARRERLEEVIYQMGLERVANTRISEISGGEGRRLALAAEVLTDPPLLFCDEPTSGLDSFTAATVVEVLVGLAREGRTVICTIHQPSSQVFAMFDSLLLLAEGRVAYLGARAAAKHHFAGLGFPCPPDYNLAEHLVAVLAVHRGDAADHRRGELLCDGFATSEEGRQVEQEVAGQVGGAVVQEGGTATWDHLAGSSSPYLATWRQQFAALAWRTGLANLRNPMAMRTRLGQAIIIALILGVLYWQQDSNQQGVQNINGALYILLAYISFAYIYFEVTAFLSELQVFRQEHFAGMYRIDAYFLARQVVDLPLSILEPLLVTTIFYWTIGLNPDPRRFATCCGLVLLCVQVVISIGYLISCSSPNLEVAFAVGPVLVIPAMLLGGFFLNTGSVPVWLAWLKYFSWFLYTFEALLVTQWEGVKGISCTQAAAMERQVITCVTTGEEVLLQMSFEVELFTRDVALLVVLAVAVRVAAFLALLVRTRGSC